MPRLALASCLVLFSAGTAAAQSPPAPGAGGAAVASMTLEEVQAMTRDIAAKVAAIRGLPFKHDVAVKIVDDAAARLHFQALTDRYWPQDQMRIEQTALTQLGLLPEGFDVREGLFSVMEEQAAGYYDLQQNVFCVLNDMPRLSAPIIIAHELTHALDDQHFDIDRTLMEHIEDSDRSTALAAVVEGSGIAVMSRFMLEEMAEGRLTMDALTEIQESEAGRGDRLRAAPQILQNGLLAPYILGQTFLLRGNIAALAMGLPAADFDRAFRTPPLSTEQILHPEKYWDPASEDTPRPVVLPDLSATLGAGWSLAGDGNLGEMPLAILTGGGRVDIASVAAITPAAWTTDAASGWDGDLWQLYSHAGRHVTLLASVWDSESEAAQFAEAVRERVRVVSVSGDAVVVAAGDAAAPLEAAAQRALDALAARHEPPAPADSRPQNPN